MTEKTAQDLQKELEALEVEKKTFYADMRAGKFDEIIQKATGTEEPAELKKAFVGPEEVNDNKPAKKAEPKKAEPVEGWKPKMGDKTGFDTSAADKKPPETDSKGYAKSTEDSEKIYDHDKADWARTEKEPGKPLEGPPHERAGGAATDKQESIKMDRAYERQKKSPEGVDEDELEKPGVHGKKTGTHDPKTKSGNEKTESERYYNKKQGYQPPSTPDDELSDMNYMWKKLPGKNKPSFNNFFNSTTMHRNPDSAKQWKDALGKAMMLLLSKSMGILTEYMYDTVGETLKKSLYSDYESDLVELIKSAFEEERDVAIEEIAKMAMEDKEITADMDAIEKAYAEGQAEEDELVKAIVSMANALEALYEEHEILKAALFDEPNEFDELAKAFRKKKKKNVLTRTTPEDSEKKEADEVELEDEPGESIRKNEEDDEELVKNGNGGAGSDSSDSKKAVRKGDVTTPDLKSKTKDPFPSQGPQAVNKGFEEGKKVGAIEAIQKSVAENGVATPPPGETLNAEREDPIAKMLNDEKQLLNMSFNKLEKTIREKD
jgi:hypothetical protein